MNALIKKLFNKLNRKPKKLSWEDQAHKLKNKNSFKSFIKNGFPNIKTLLMILLAIAVLAVILILLEGLCPAFEQVLNKNESNIFVKIVRFLTDFLTELIGLIALGIALLIYFEQREVAKFNSDKNSSISINSLKYINLNRLGNYNDEFPTIHASFIIKCDADKPNTYKEIAISKLIVFVKDDCDNYYSEKIKIKQKWEHHQNGKAELSLCGLNASTTLINHIDNKIRLSSFQQKIMLNDDRKKIGILLKTKSTNHILCFRYIRATWLFLTLIKESEKDFRSCYNCNISLNKKKIEIIDNLKNTSNNDFEKEVLNNLKEQLIEKTANKVYNDLIYNNFDETDFKIINTMVI